MVTTIEGEYAGERLIVVRDHGKALEVCSVDEGVDGKNFLVNAVLVRPFPPVVVKTTSDGGLILSEE